MVTDLSTFLLDNAERVFRFLIYKKIFTPYEIERRYRDQSEFTDISYSYGRFEQAIELPNKEVMLGIRMQYDDIFADNLKFYNISEIRFSLLDE